MKNLEAKTVVTEDRYAYMNAKTFKEFLKLYPYDDSAYEDDDIWMKPLLKFLMVTYVNNWKTFRRIAFNPHRLCWNNGEICIYEDSDTLYPACKTNDVIGNRYYSGNINYIEWLNRNVSATLNYERWRNRENTICWINMYWLGCDIPEPLFMNRTNKRKVGKWEWERIFNMMAWIVWDVADNGKTEGTETIEPNFCKGDAHVFYKWDAGKSILEWAKRNVDKLQ